jgi:phosphopantothenoylcysteine decarboxylase/phosphopantothenate--cysteine ligase
VDAIFHAAAVSDYAFGKIFAPDESGRMAEIKTGKKIPTRQGKLFVELLPTPKILAELRSWFPRTKIVGWKFEAEGKRADAIAAARKEIAGCRTELCVVNGPAYGEGFGLISHDSTEAHLPTPPVLFDVLEKMAGKPQETP